ncbi:MAG: response regulator, partial [Planctomycetes bacterium]|nr:response regulator [Planctomycetota bacterium]
MPKRILICDDAEAVARNIETMLTQEGYECRVVTDGEACYQAATSEHFDLLCLDVKMPGFSGAEVIDVIEVERPDLNVLVVSGIRSRKEREEVEENPMVRGWVDKPFTRATLVAIVEGIIGKAADA